jgi:CMP-N,N'-diacetyllegionaminic acid synthase
VVFSVVPARRNPYFNMVERHLEDDVVRLVKNGNFTCRQEAPEVYEMNASIYAYRSDALRNFPKSLFDLRNGMVTMKDYGVLDIDSPEDHQLMQLIYEKICLSEHQYFGDKLAFARRR